MVLCFVTLDLWCIGPVHVAGGAADAATLQGQLKSFCSWTCINAVKVVSVDKIGSDVQVDSVLIPWQLDEPGLPVNAAAAAACLAMRAASAFCTSSVTGTQLNSSPSVSVEIDDCSSLLLR